MLQGGPRGRLGPMPFDRRQHGNHPQGGNQWEDNVEHEVGQEAREEHGNRYHGGHQRGYHYNDQGGHKGRDVGINSIKMTHPTFKGECNPDAYLEWESQCDRIFNVNELAEVKSSCYAIAQFERQGSKSVEAYHDQFQNIVMKLEYREIEEHAVIRFKVGLNKEISSKMTLHRFATLNDAFEATNEIELEFKEEKVAKYKTSSSNSWSKNKGGAQTSSGWNKGSDVKKPYEKKPFEGNTPKYPPRDKGITDPTKFPKEGEIYLSEEREQEKGCEEDPQEEDEFEDGQDE
ncbi:hypothetical protein KY290_016986 [Solanum tuberosum]|uniref:Retrotransposon gag domain-containing protein n=1 Tax=Solanum tuberosum TaxID=4113 RepID=A0ABQ7VC44_SOLTU|nr:hypothetical protein KY284_016057 [Solanum tuberosum]KAH0760913.1 hypothetical protein KY290_016986 [Solanum tuberosum]